MLETWWRRPAAALAIGMSLVLAAPVAEPAAATSEDFVVDDAAALALVGTDESHYAEAINMCYGFTSGVTQYALLLFEASGGGFVCLPDPPPSRAEAIAEFVTWVDDHTEFADVEAPEAVVRFLQERFPCP